MVQLGRGENTPPEEQSQSFKKLEKPGIRLHCRGYVCTHGRQILRADKSGARLGTSSGVRMGFKSVKRNINAATNKQQVEQPIVTLF